MCVYMYTKICMCQVNHPLVSMHFLRLDCDWETCAFVSDALRRSNQNSPGHTCNVRCFAEIALHEVSEISAQTAFSEGSSENTWYALQGGATKHCTFTLINIGEPNQHSTYTYGPSPCCMGRMHFALLDIQEHNLRTVRQRSLRHKMPAVTTK